MKLAEIREQVRPKWPVIDCHVHPLDCFGMYDVKTPEEDAERLIASARRAGIERKGFRQRLLREVEVGKTAGMSE